MQEKKKEYLKLYLLQEARINRLQEMCRINPQNKEIYKSEMAEAKSLRIEIENKICLVSDPLLCELLYQKYIFGKTLEEISLILNYSKRHIERLHIKALEKFNM